jgi:hypothetical protein
MKIKFLIFCQINESFYRINKAILKIWAKNIALRFFKIYFVIVGKSGI